MMLINALLIRCYKILRKHGHIPPPPPFVDTKEDLAWLDDDDGSKMEAAIQQFKADGYEAAPYDHRPDESRYEYAFYGPLLYLRPRVRR